MSLVISKVFTYDTDAGNYIQAVEAADGQALEAGTRQAINNFVIGCKQDGIWSAIKASCILSGARTLNGALQPLVGTAPTNFNFVSGDYNRKTGLVGNRLNKYLSSNRNNNDDDKDDCHVSVYASSLGTVSGAYIGAGTNASAAKALQLGIGHKCSNASFTNDATPETGFIGVSRSTSASYIYLNGASLPETIAIVSEALLSQIINVFQRGGSAYSNAHLAFYSIGESLDLALLDARVTALITAFGVAIP